MGQNELTEGRPLIGYLIVVFRVPVGLAGTVIVTAFFVIWLLLETTIALVAFLLAAVFADQNWIKASWLGQYPVALREFSRDGFKYLRVIWHWVTNPMEGVDLSRDMGDETPVSPPAESVGSTGWKEAWGRFAAWLDTGWGCLALALIAFGVIAGIVKGCN